MTSQFRHRFSQWASSRQHLLELPRLLLCEGGSSLQSGFYLGKTLPISSAECKSGRNLSSEECLKSVRLLGVRERCLWRGYISICRSARDAMMAECFCLCFYLFIFTVFVLPYCIFLLWYCRSRKRKYPCYPRTRSSGIVNTWKEEFEVWGTIFCFGVFF